MGRLTQVDRLGVQRVDASGNLQAATLSDKFSYDQLGQRLTHTNALILITRTDRSMPMVCWERSAMPSRERCALLGIAQVDALYHNDPYALGASVPVTSLAVLEAIGNAGNAAETAAAAARMDLSAQFAVSKTPQGVRLQYVDPNGWSAVGGDSHGIIGFVDKDGILGVDVYASAELRAQYGSGRDMHVQQHDDEAPAGECRNCRHSRSVVERHRQRELCAISKWFGGWVGACAVGSEYVDREAGPELWLWSSREHHGQ